MSSQLKGILPVEVRHVQAQKDFLSSEKRFNVAPAGRRSGKTMTGKLRGRKRALTIPHDDGRVVFGAPTHRQAKRVFWKHVKRMFKPFTRGRPLDGEMQLTLVTGTVVEVTGLDVPERIEGAPLDHIHLDEYANMKPEVWTDHIRPMLAERDGTADFTGTPEGRNHYYDLFLEAQDDPEWGAFTWTSEDVLPAKEVERLKKDLDELTYQQECLASFLNFEGRAYYEFDIKKHVGATYYDPEQPICLCMDFNAKPGTCSVVQEHRDVSHIIFEVFLKRYSNTVEVCEFFLRRFKDHKGFVRLYGDPAGNQRKSSGIRGTDWDLVRDTLKPVFGDRIQWRVPRSAPSVKDSINAVNARFRKGAVIVDPSCQWMIRDLDGSERDESGDLVKKKEEWLTHLTDGFRYYVDRNYPIQGVIGTTVSL